MKYTETAPNWCPQPLKYFKLSPEAFAPEWGTEHAACFDLRACLIHGTQVTVYHQDNTKHHNVVDTYPVDTEPDNYLKEYLYIFPGQRVMVPTNLIFDIPIGYSVRLHNRSGCALKQGLVLANMEGIIDSDYFHPTYMVLKNTSTCVVPVFHGDRVAQGEMVLDMAYIVEETPDQPKQRTDRVGGFGSTGVQ